MEPHLFYLTAPQLRKLLSVVSDGCSHSVLCCMLSYWRLNLGRNLCVGPLFLQKLWSALRFQAHLSLPRLPMQWRTTVLPLIEGQEDLVAWLACPRYEKSHDPLMKTLHEPVTVCKNFKGIIFAVRVKTAKILLLENLSLYGNVHHTIADCDLYRAGAGYTYCYTSHYLPFIPYGNLHVAREW